MADKKKSKKTGDEQVELLEAKQEVKGTKSLAPKGRQQANNASTVGEFPMRTYEMFRNRFVGIN